MEGNASFSYVSAIGTAISPSGERVGQDALFILTFRDLSVDPKPDRGTPITHITDFSVQFAPGSDADLAWSYSVPVSVLTTSGLSQQVFLQVQHLQSIRLREVEVLLTATMRYGDANYGNETVSHTYPFLVRILPQPGLQIQVVYDGPFAAPLQARPNSPVTIPVRVENTDFYGQQFELSFAVAETAGVVPEKIPVEGVGTFLLEPRGSEGSTRIFNITFRTPKEQVYYGSVSLQYTITARSLELSEFQTRTDGIVAVQGFYFSRSLVVAVPLLMVALVAGLLILVLWRRYFNERILGQPIPPWRIPAEVVPLTALKRTDPRAFYLLRYFVMEQEYQSALFWFHAYKKRAKREIEAQAESASYMERAHSLEQPDLTPFDRRADRIRRRIHRRQERQKLKAQAKIDKLQAKLEQHYEEDFEKAHEKWAEKVEKIKKKANKPWYREHKKWEAEVERITEEWEKPFRKEKAKHDKEVARARATHEAQVKREDKAAWKDWREAVENAERENRVRAKEEREPLPLPELVSSVVGPPELPAPFQEPARPRLPAEPKPPKELDLPPEPVHDKPVLAQSRYARKERRVHRKAERKVRRLEKKLNRLLARNERDRVRALAKADRKRRRYLRKSERVAEPSLMARLLHLTPEDRERRNAKRLQRALAKERINALEEQESTRLEVLQVDAQRQEAELTAKLIRDRAQVRKGASGAGMDAGILSEEEARLKELRAAHATRLAKERAASEERVQKARAKIEEELAASTARSKTEADPAPPAAAPARRTRGPAKSKK